MRVLVTAYPEPPIWTFITELCHGLEPDGVQIVLAVMSGPLSDEQRATLRDFGNVQFHESTFSAEWSDCDIYEIERAGEWLLGLARDFDVDIVHLNEISFSALPWNAPVLYAILRAPVLPIEAATKSTRAASHVAGALIAPTRQLLEEARSIYGSVHRSLVVPFGRTSEMLTECGKEPIVVAMADSAHDVASVAAPVRIASRISWPLFVIGATPPPLQGTSRANAHFMGVLHEADRSSVLNRASVFVQAAEAAGYAVLDAALCGCALVLPDVPELREQWDGAAAFVAPDDDETLRSNLIWLIDDADARGDLGMRARHRAQTFSAERMAAAYLSTYIELALNGRVAPDLTPSPSRSTGRPELSHS